MASPFPDNFDPIALERRLVSLEHELSCLRVLIQQQHGAHEGEHIMQKEILKARDAVIDHRLEELNNIRSNVISDRSEFVKREAYELRVASIERLLYMGLGGLAVIQALLFFFFKR